MSAGKNPFLRYRIIHSCFSNRQKPFWTKLELKKVLAEHDLAVSMRTLVTDLSEMSNSKTLGYFAPIKYDRKRKGHYYTNPHFSLDKLPINQEDLQTLTAAVNILQQYKGIQLVHQFEGVADKLSKVINHSQNPEDQNIIAFENAPYYKGHEHFDQLYRAALTKQVLCITYRKFDETKDSEHIFHPYCLKEYRGRWYALGYSEARYQIITLGLDRMERVVPSSNVFKKNKSFKPGEYFQHTLGITLGKGPAEKIELWFSPTQAPYIKTQHIHKTQKTIHEDEKGLIISLKLIPNPELMQLLSSHGAEVRVLNSPVLKEKLRASYRKALEGIDK
jgi:predicted DNA-binding transcriptional regulator YafY